MSIFRRDARRDANEPAVIAALMLAGARVWRLSQPFDLLVAHSGRWYVMEVKTEDGRLTEQQIEDIELCESVGVDVPVVRTIDEALKAIGVTR